MRVTLKKYTYKDADGNPATEWDVLYDYGNYFLFDRTTGDLLPVMGTAGFVPKLQSAGLLPVKNYSAGTSDRASEIGGESFAKDHNIGCTGCTYCPIKCERLMRNDLGTLMGPGLEAMVLLGSNIQNYDVNLIIKWSRKLHELGLDLRTAANVLAQAMDEGGHGVAFGKSECASCFPRSHPGKRSSLQRLRSKLRDSTLRLLPSAAT